MCNCQGNLFSDYYCDGPFDAIGKKIQIGDIVTYPAIEKPYGELLTMHYMLVEKFGPNGNIIGPHLEYSGAYRWTVGKSVTVLRLWRVTVLSKEQRDWIISRTSI